MHSISQARLFLAKREQVHKYDKMNASNNIQLFGIAFINFSLQFACI